MDIAYSNKQIRANGSRAKDNCIVEINLRKNSQKDCKENDSQPKS
jgi:hypothetical protein